MSEQTSESKNVFKYRPTEDGCCDIYMASTDTEETIKFPAEIDGLRVTAIGYEACKDCKNVKVVFIPEGVTRIKSFAFCGCKSLIRVHLPSTLEKGITEIFYNSGASLLTCSKGKRPLCPIDESRFPKKNVLVAGVGAGKDFGNGNVGICTLSPFDETYFDILFQNTVDFRSAVLAAVSRVDNDGDTVVDIRGSMRGNIGKSREHHDTKGNQEYRENNQIDRFYFHIITDSCI